jgi:predicted dehydrogenase
VATAALGIPDELLFPDLDAAQRAADPEAALVTTGLLAHVPVTLAAFDAGLDVLVEKPFAPTLGAAAAVVRAADSAGRVLAVSQNYRHHPAPQLAAELVRAGRIGTVAAVEVDFRRSGRQAVEEAVQRGVRQPLLVDMAIHHFDLLRVVLGREPTWIECHGMQPHGPHRDPLAAYASIGFDGPVLVSYRGSWISSGTPTAWAGEWRMEGTEGAIEWTGRGDSGQVADRLQVRRPGRPPEVLPLPDVAALDRAGVLGAFTAAIRTGSEPASSGRENLLTLALTLAAARSATEGRRVAIAELLTDVPEDLR